MSLDDDFRRDLSSLADRSRLRDTRAFSGLDRAHPLTPDGRQLLSFCSNDYLGLSSHPALANAAVKEINSFGMGGGAARLVSGESPAHQALETTLAGFLGAPAALSFSTGYLANIGVITALAGPLDLIVSDAANHASIIDGCRLSRARVTVYPHLDLAFAADALRTAGSFRRRFLVTESLFSMDGDRAPLLELHSLALAQDAALIVDEAHALGTLGPAGRGLCALAGVLPDVLVGTLGKSFGTLGGFAAGSELLRRFLLNRSRPFIYSTAAPPALAAAAATAVHLAASPEGDDRRQSAHRLADQLRTGLDRIGLQHLGRDLIIPVLLGPDAAAVAASRALLEQGILVPAIRPPTVPEGTARLRITVSALHTQSEIDRLLGSLASLRPHPLSHDPP